MKMNAASPMMLNKPDLAEFCADEIRDFVLELVGRALKEIPAGKECRRRELCEAILSANRESGGRARLRDAADEILKDWKAQESQIAALEKQGFIVTQGRKHYKLRRDNAGYFVTLPASPSDHRGGANAVSDFNGKFF
ncbi:MAG: hypothetical protein PHW17_14105 [Desulfobacterales bacterium]|nr:hypothetical protein [Desulfobacterales bacterium]